MKSLYTLRRRNKAKSKVSGGYNYALPLYHHLSFDALFPLSIGDPSLLPRGKPQNNPDAVGSHTKTIS